MVDHHGFYNYKIIQDALAMAGWNLVVKGTSAFSVNFFKFSL